SHKNPVHPWQYLWLLCQTLPRRLSQTWSLSERVSRLPPNRNIKSIKHDQIIKQAGNQQKSVAILVGRTHGVCSVIRESDSQDPTQDKRRSTTQVRDHRRHLKQSRESLFSSCHCVEQMPSHQYSQGETPPHCSSQKQ